MAGVKRDQKQSLVWVTPYEEVQTIQDSSEETKEEEMEHSRVRGITNSENETSKLTRNDKRDAESRELSNLGECSEVRQEIMKDHDHSKRARYSLETDGVEEIRVINTTNDEKSDENKFERSAMQRTYERDSIQEAITVDLIGMMQHGLPTRFRPASAWVNAS
ncbi:uncharacterized protein LOC114542099 [Dendronephthya gigantea]|uniref:uncharacterized protein LOC114542099 n=1 Tax=Dendronephthya gigantea TaxID=151771 RepID=UPI00106CBEA8|nr:uncharacterized protein LOC114542099 [Dendronephthya gigantea]